MNISIKPIQKIRVSYNGRELARDFVVDSTWKGFACLKDSMTGDELIIENPSRPLNPWDMFGRIFGGNKDDIAAAQTKVVSASPNLALELKKLEGTA